MNETERIWLLLYQPSFKSLVSSLLVSFSPAGTSAIVTYFCWDPKHKSSLCILGGLMVMLSVYLFVLTVLVHCKKIRIDEYGVHVVGPLSVVQMRWSEIMNATLRERENVVSRADRMLILHSRNGKLVFNTSTLSPECEEEVLKAIRAKTTLVVQHHKPSVVFLN